MTQTLMKWTPCILFGTVGLFFLFMTYGALIQSKRTGKYVSGVPGCGGLFIAIAFLLSPCKWLAVLALTDYGIWMISWLLISEYLIPILKKKKHDDP